MNIVNFCVCVANIYLYKASRKYRSTVQIRNPQQVVNPFMAMSPYASCVLLLGLLSLALSLNAGGCSQSVRAFAWMWLLIKCAWCTSSGSRFAWVQWTNKKYEKLSLGYQESSFKWKKNDFLLLYSIDYYSFVAYA